MKLLNWTKGSIVYFLPPLCACLLLTLGILVISLWRADENSQPFDWRPEVHQVHFYLGLLTGVALSLVLFPLAIKGPLKYLAPFRDAVNMGSFVTWLIIFFLVVVFCGAVANTVEPISGKDGLTSWLIHAQKNPGGCFAIITGMATVIALWYTWRGLSALRQTVSSFSDLIDRVCDMARKASADNPLRILAYTPAVGFLAQPMRDWNRFRDALDRKPEGEPIAEVVCLRSEDLAVWHSLFEGRRTLRGKVTHEMAIEATNASNGLLDAISRNSRSEQVKTPTVHRLPWRFMPGYYLFFTRERAIVVTPLFFPFPKGAPKDQQEQLPTVQMIGLDTQDRAIIRDVESIFGYYKDLPTAPLAEAEQAVSCQDLQAWLTDAALANPVMNSLRDKLIISLKVPKAADLRHPPHPQCEVSLGLDAHFKTWELRSQRGTA